MSLQFIGDVGAYLPDRDAVKITALAGDSVIGCYVMRSALDAIGCRSLMQALNILEKFEARRLDCEIAAMVKFRRATAKVLSLEISAADLAVAEGSREAYLRSVRRVQRFAQRLGVLSAGALPGIPRTDPAGIPRSTESAVLSSKRTKGGLPPVASLR